MPKKYTIPEHWDTSGEITATSDPRAEFELWRRHAYKPWTEWKGDEFTLQDFERHIASLQPMRTYRVKWEIDIEAGSPEEAARKALEIHRNSESIANVFDVEANGETVRIDLEQGETSTVERLEK